MRPSKHGYLSAQQRCCYTVCYVCQAALSLLLIPPTKQYCHLCPTSPSNTCHLRLDFHFLPTLTLLAASARATLRKFCLLPSITATNVSFQATLLLLLQLLLLLLLPLLLLLLLLVLLLLRSRSLAPGAMSLQTKQHNANKKKTRHRK